MVSSKDIPEFQEWMNDAWVFFKRYYKVDNTDKYWQNMADESVKLVNKYPNFFTESVVLGFVGWREEQVKKGWHKRSYVLKGLIDKLQRDLIKIEAEERKQAEIEADKNQITLDDIWKEYQ